MGISFEEATGATPPAGAKPAGPSTPAGGGINFAEESGGGQPKADLADKSFFSRVGDFFNSMSNLHAEGERNQSKYTAAGGKSLIAGTGSMADLAIQGVAGLARASMERTSDPHLAEAFEKGSVAAADFNAKAADIASKVTKLNFAPVTMEDQAANDFLALLPQGITAAGDTVFQKTNSALAGAGTQAFLTLLTLKPGIVAKGFAPLKMLGKVELTPAAEAAAKISKTAVDELAAKDPNAARRLAEHVGEADPELKKLLDKQIDKAAGASERKQEIIGREAANPPKPRMRVVENPETFQKWFAGSVVTNADFSPKPVYHGTSGDFYNFSENARGKATGAQTAKKAFWFTDSPETAGSYAENASVKGGKLVTEEVEHPLAPGAKIKTQVPVGSNIRPSFLQMKNPLVIDAMGKGPKEVNLGRLVNSAKKHGHDGVVVKNFLDTPGSSVEPPAEPSTHFAVFDKAQIRSTFDPSPKPRVRMVTPEEAAANIRTTVGEMYDTLDKPRSEPTQSVAAGSKADSVKYNVSDRQHTFTSENGKTVAYKRGEQLQVTTTDTTEAARGKGEGTARMERAFREAQSAGLKLTSDTKVSPDQVRVYEAMKKRGYEIVENSSTLDAEGNKVSDSSRPVYEVRSGPMAKMEAAIKDDPVIFVDHGQPVTRAAVKNAFRIGRNAMQSVPGLRLIETKLSEYFRQAAETFAPEALGNEAKAAGAIVAKNIAEQMQKDSSYTHKSATRRGFWNARLPEAAEFLNKFDKGEKFADPQLNAAAEAYRAWNQEIFDRELFAKFKYDPASNYLYNVFEKGDELAQFMEKRYGPRWKDPAFILKNGFKMYQEAVESGLRPRYTNPEDLMLARQHASDIASMRVQVLQDLEGAGLARLHEGGGKGRPPDFPSTEWRSPDGKRYWVHNSANAIMHNAFNTKSLWTMKGIAGDTFRGAMFLKNTIVPIKLALSLFHPLHVLTIDNATGMVRASKELLSGTTSPARWMAEMAKSTAYFDIISSPKAGGHVLKAYRGKISSAELTDVDKLALQYMADGGFIPEMSSQYRTNAVQKFVDAVQRRSVSAVWHAPLAAINLLQKPMFEVWIPSLKIASYLKDVRTAMRTDPELASNPLKRQIAFRKISKSVDNRYGEMAYSTLFWNRWVKDLAVANTLSLGWQMGFIREYGGGILDIGQMATKEGSLPQKVKSGMLDRPLFVTFYTTQALAYGGLLTWALSGKPPENLTDYVYPKNGETNKDGTEQRVNTMFYPREFFSIYKHMENQGVVSGMGHLAASKSSGLIGMTAEWATGVNGFGQEIRDPNAPAFKKLEQTLAATLIDLEPISINSINSKASEHPVKTGALAVAGFSPAPRYVTETTTEGRIRSVYDKYYSMKQTPFEKAQYSVDMHQAQKDYDEGDMDGYSTKLDKMVEKFQLTAKEQRKLEHTIANSGQEDYTLKMFQRFTWQQQKHLLDQMTEEERDKYITVSNREHLRYDYQPPEEK